MQRSIERATFYAGFLIGGLWFLLCSALGIVWLLLAPRNRQTLFMYGRVFCRGLVRLMGWRIEVANRETLDSARPCVIVGNHQSFLDVVTFGSIFPERTVSAGKREIGRIPVFGWFYRLSGNLVIDRGNPRGTRDSLEEAARTIREEGLSVWFMPEGHRNTGRELLAFKSGAFRLVSDHLLQKGPAFSQPLEAWIDRASGRVRVRYSDDDGKEKNVDEEMKLPDDLSNGIILTVLKNVPPQAAPPTLSMVAFTPKPRVVKLEISRAANDQFTLNGFPRSATHYVVHIDIGGFAGLVAPLVGKQPPDSGVWVLPGAAPAFVKSEGPLHLGGPIWRIELVSPVWRQDATATTGQRRSPQRRR